MELNTRSGLLNSFGKYILYYSLYLGSGSIYLFLEGGARLENYKPTDESWLINYLFVTCILFFLIYIFICLFRTKGVLSNNGGWWVLVSLGLVFLSFLWASVPFTSFGVGAFILTWYFYINSYIKSVGAEAVLNQAAAFVFAMTFMSLVVALFYPTYGVSVGAHEGSWQGIFTHKNTLGYVALLAFVLVGLSSWRLTYKVIYLFMCSFVIFKSRSDAALGFLILTPAIYLLWRLRIGRRPISEMLGGAIVLSILFSALLLWDSMAPNFLNNRGKIWAFVISHFGESPFLGHGVYQYPKFAEASSEIILMQIGFFVRGAHNGFIDAIYSLGILAFVPVSAMIMRAFNAKKSGEAGFLYGIFFIYVNMFESNFLSINVFLMILLLIISLGEVRVPSKACQ